MDSNILLGLYQLYKQLNQLLGNIVTEKLIIVKQVIFNFETATYQRTVLLFYAWKSNPGLFCSKSLRLQTKNLVTWGTKLRAQIRALHIYSGLATSGSDRLLPFGYF